MAAASDLQSQWPSIPFAEWQPTATALHLFMQIVGKYRLAHSPWINHSWHATFYVRPCGITTSIIPDGDGAIEVEFDFLKHRLVVQSVSGQTSGFALEAMSVADFHEQFVESINLLGGRPIFHGAPNELPDAIRFADDRQDRPYDAEAITRFHRALVSVDRIFSLFRTGFRGKTSPVHLFWGSFDLAVTRFSGRRAPIHPGGIPNLPDAVTREAYSHEVASAGFWAGGGPVDQAAFYAYTYPEPDGFSKARIVPSSAMYNQEFGEFVLLYDEVRRSDDPALTLIGFLESTYEAAATLGHWDRMKLECPQGLVGVPPSLDVDV